MPTQQHPFHTHLIAHKYYTNKYLKSVSFHLQPTSKTSIHISSTHQVTSSELLTAAPYKSDTNNSNIQTPHPAQSLQVTLLSLKQTKAKLTQPFSTFIKIHHPKFKASFSKPNSVSIHKTPIDHSIRQAALSTSLPSTIHYTTIYSVPSCSFTQVPP